MKQLLGHSVFIYLIITCVCEKLNDSIMWGRGGPKVMSLAQSDMCSSNFGRSDSELCPVAEFDFSLSLKVLNLLLKDTDTDTGGKIEKCIRRNVVFSSLSFEYMLRVLELGSCGETQSQLLHVFKANDWIKNDTEWHKTAKHTLNLMKPGEDEDGDKFNQIYMALGLFIDNTYQITEEFKNSAADFYDAQVRPVDFDKEKSEAVAAMNSFVSEKSLKKIGNIVAESDIELKTAMFAINSVYFKGTWNVPFDKSQTQVYNFNVAVNGDQKIQYEPHKTIFMFITSDFNWYRNTDIGIEALELPYAGKNVSFLVVRNIKHTNYVIGGEMNTEHPELTLSEIINLFNTDPNKQINDLLQKPRRTRMFVGLPKFAVEDSVEMNDLLKAMGVTNVFQDTADFCRLEKTQNLKLNKIKQIAKVDVNEVGTEAAAATSVHVVAKGMPRDFICDYEFMYFIYHKTANTVMFAGTYTQPPKKTLATAKTA